MPKKVTQNDIIARFNASHGEGTYDYSKVVYVAAKIKVVIICPKHGEFEQAPDTHCRQTGCPACGKDKADTARTKSLDLVISEFKEAHGDKYDYAKVIYRGDKCKVEIICKKHKSFWQEPVSHRKRHGCPTCSATKNGRKQRKTADNFIAEATKRHEGKYRYNKCNYIAARKKVLITCDNHGDFFITGNHHLKGVGCPSCAKGGFNPDKAGFLYLLHSGCGRYMKIGITNNLENRTGNLIRKTPFDITLADSIKIDGREAKELESTLHKLFTSASFSGFDGHTEWFKKDLDDLKKLFVI